MLNNYFNIGDKVLVIPRSDDEETADTKVELVSELYDWIDETHLKLAMPIKEGMTVPLSVGLSIELNFYGVRGIYYCDAVITDRRHEENLDVFTASIVSEVERLQRRQFYRLPNSLDIEFKLQNESDSEDEQENTKPWIQARMIDISGGGIRFLAKEELQSDSMIQVRLVFSNDDKYYEYFADCKIIESSVSQEQKGYYENRVSFINLPIDQQENIIKYIFAIERLQRKTLKEHKEKGLT